MECPPTRRSARTDLYLTEEILVDQSESGEFLRHGSLTTTNVFLHRSETRNCSIQSVGRTSNKNNSVRSLEMSSSGVPLAKDIRLTRRSSTSDESLSGSVQLVSDYPPTPPSMHPGQQFLPKRILAEWSIPPTMDLSPKSLTSSSPDLSNPASIDVSLVAVTCQEEEQRRRCRRRSVSWKRRYRSLSLSCPPLMKKYSTIQRLRKRRRSSLIKREKCQSIDDEQIRELLVELLDEVTSMESRDPRKKLSTEIIHELIRGAKGLDRLSCSVKSLTETMETFLHLSTNKQSIKLVHLREELEKCVTISTLGLIPHVDLL